MPETTLFQALGGHDGALRLARAWHERVMADEVVAHAFSHGFIRIIPSDSLLIGARRGADPQRTATSMAASLEW